MAGKFKMIVRGMLVFLAIVSVGIWFKPADRYSDSERRELAQFPKVSLDTVLSGRFMSDFEEYVTDQFPFRETFRGIKVWFSETVLGQKDSNGFYKAEGHISAMEYPLREDSIDRAIERIHYIYERYLKDANTQVYYSIIPDKNYFLAEANGYLAMDYEKFFGILDDAFEEMTEIDITNQLILDDYYTTDLHWRQENLMDVADFLLEGMGQDLKGDYELQKLDVPFYGVYASQSAYDAKADNICYWTNEQLEQYRAYNYETKKTTGVYDMDKAYGKDPYEMFLSGPVSLVHVENANAVSEKNLIVFRDSFGSSVAPLLVEPYAKVTFVDIRYIHPDLLGNYVDFENADVLFLYSTSVLNNGDTFK